MLSEGMARETAKIEKIMQQPLAVASLKSNIPLTLGIIGGSIGLYALLGRLPSIIFLTTGAALAVRMRAAGGVCATVFLIYKLSSGGVS